MALLLSLNALAVASHAQTTQFDGLAETGALDAYGLELRFFPVCDFQRQGVAALFCTPMYAPAGAEAHYGHRAFPALTATDWATIDVAILEHALAFAARLAEAGIVVAVGASVSYATLDDPSGRQHYRAALRGAHVREQAMLALKIEDIPEQAGGRRIAEIVSCVRTLVPRVFVHLPSSQMPLDHREPLHALGLVLSVPARLPLHGIQSEARWLARHAQQQSALASMDHVDTRLELETVRNAGIRFAAGQALGRPALKHDASIEEIRAVLYGRTVM